MDWIWYIFGDRKRLRYDWEVSQREFWLQRFQMVCHWLSSSLLPDRRNVQHEELQVRNKVSADFRLSLLPLRLLFSISCKIFNSAVLLIRLYTLRRRVSSSNTGVRDCVTFFLKTWIFIIAAAIFISTITCVYKYPSCVFLSTAFDFPWCKFFLNSGIFDTYNSVEFWFPDPEAVFAWRSSNEECFTV